MVTIRIARRGLRQTVLLLALVSAVNSLSSCAPSEPFSRISVTIDSERHLVTRYRNCGEKVTEVRLDSGGRAIWLLQGHPGSSARVFVGGDPTPSLDVIVPMYVLEPGEYTVSMVTDARSTGSLRFSQSELKPGVVVWDRGVMSQTDFDAMSDADLGCTWSLDYYGFTQLARAIPLTNASINSVVYDPAARYVRHSQAQVCRDRTFLGQDCSVGTYNYWSFPVTQVPLLSAEGVNLQYGTSSALAGIDLSADSGESLAVVGPSGSGKTSLLRCLSGLQPPTDGFVPWQGDDLYAMSDRNRSRIRLSNFGFVFQSAELLAELSLLENIALPVELVGHGRRHTLDASTSSVDADADADADVRQRDMDDTHDRELRRLKRVCALKGPLAPYLDPNALGELHQARIRSERDKNLGNRRPQTPTPPVPHCDVDARSALAVAERCGEGEACDCQCCGASE